MSRSLKLISLLILTLWLGSALGTPKVYTDEATYLQALKTAGFTVMQEGFEDDQIWNASRGTPISPGKASSINSHGLVWLSNQKGHGVGTDHYNSQGKSSYRFYSNPHGRQFDRNMQTGCDRQSDHQEVPEPCWQQDGWRIRSRLDDTRLFAVGGWYSSASGGAKITYLLDGKDILQDNRQHDGHRIHADWSFFGVIDTAGFREAEIREMAGKAGEPQYVYGDSFTIGYPQVKRRARTESDSAIQSVQPIRE